jgi:hypothetical protein
MKPFATKILYERKCNDRKLEIPAWISDRLGEMIEVEYNGIELIISPIAHGDTF